eukprot:3342444-Lingulodinium_polyedra.AAC.1
MPPRRAFGGPAAQFRCSHGWQRRLAAARGAPAKRRLAFLPFPWQSHFGWEGAAARSDGGGSGVSSLCRATAV